MEIWPLALKHEWEAAAEAGEYRVSTHGASLDDVGYMHGAIDPAWVLDVLPAHIAHAQLVVEGRRTL